MSISQIFKIQIEQDISRCENQKSICHSEGLYCELVNRYRTSIKDFMQKLPSTRKPPTSVCGADYRPELQLIASKLRTYLLEQERVGNTAADNPVKKKVDDFIQRGVDIGRLEFCPPGNGLFVAHVSGPLYDAWMGEINIFNERYLKDHPLHDSIHSTYFHKRPSAYNDMMGYLRALAADVDFFITNSNQLQHSKERGIMSNKVFIVHGHDEAAKLDTARTLEKAGFEAIILHEQPDMGRTIIEKFEDYADVSFAVILYTECDLGRAKENPAGSEQYRARQNVVFEHGFFVGRLGRDHVCALVKGNVEIPSDLDGIVYVSMDAAGMWKISLAKNMQAVGLPVDLNKFV